MDPDIFHNVNETTRAIRVQSAIRDDNVLHITITVITNGFPEDKTYLSAEIILYWPCHDESTVLNGMIHGGTKVLIQPI